jgi:hypothetical protein
MGLPRFLAVARVDDPERTAYLADEQVDSDARGPVVLLQCGRSELSPSTIARELQKRGRRSINLTIRDRQMAQADETLARMAGAAAVWVFSDDLLDTFMSTFATTLAWSLRAKARSGLPVVGVGGGALALGGLMLATRVCHRSQYELVGGLGWANRVFVDSDCVGFVKDPSIAYQTVRSLPGLLGIHLGSEGGIRVEGGRIESVGTEPIELRGCDGNGALLQLSIDPGRTATIAPPPFAPFEQGLLPQQTLSALARDGRQSRPAPQRPAAAKEQPPKPLREAPPPPDDMPHSTPTHEETQKGGRYCGMCRRVHGGTEAKLSLAA